MTSIESHSRQYDIEVMNEYLQEMQRVVQILQTRGSRPFPAFGCIRHFKGSICDSSRSVGKSVSRASNCSGDLSPCPVARALGGQCEWQFHVHPTLAAQSDRQCHPTPFTICENEVISIWTKRSSLG